MHEGWAYTQTAAATTYQADNGVTGMNESAYGLQTNVHGKAHLSVIGWVLVSVAALVLMDKAGFKFMFLAGKG